MRNFLNRIFGQLLTFKKKPSNPRTFIFPSEKKASILKQLDDHMQLRQPYLIENYSLKALADDLNIQQLHLSALLNHELGINFNNYLNQYRVRYCKTLIQKGATRNLNSKGLASQCGFHNRNTFTTAFKKFAGCTPSDYAKRYYSSNFSSTTVFES